MNESCDSEMVPSQAIESKSPKLITEINHHKDSGGLNDLITIYGIGPRSKGGAQDDFLVVYLNKNGHIQQQQIKFQSGVQTENGINGITAEVLLAILITRMDSFMRGEFPCVETENALCACKQALNFLKERTANRLARGVLGKYTK